MRIYDSSLNINFIINFVAYCKLILFLLGVNTVFTWLFSTYIAFHSSDFFTFVTNIASCFCSFLFHWFCCAFFFSRHLCFFSSGCFDVFCGLFACLTFRTLYLHLALRQEICNIISFSCQSNCKTKVGQSFFWKAFSI